MFGSAAATGEALVSLGFILLGAFLCYHSLTRLNAFGAGQTGPGVLPFFGGVVMILASVKTLLRLRSRGPDEDIELPDRQGAGRVAALIGLTAAAVAGLLLIGTLVTLALFTSVELRLIERRSWSFSIVAGLAVAAVVYLIFVAVLGINLPHGLLGLP
ncbi:MAG TPA: tripartite tricarboxylate transporter TctB family protein [Amaricoccus sp.]|uniref:tripartite tricarboxylate transporter TctB family protein n=1 Tax=Amaricoccus sp. TaxID=1872485 RepID=UPI002CD90150|nr:tripartite tricarboxylate transporter TctB family protein [Amaricoccus sp.]HMR34232.1 tripartite tricarboxylate transporter TctB family protein [Geminicoccus sp.]HMU00774.1 tripartite tricarboxylate transporter TctB family protein [Amaricoccus sp.]